MVKFFMAVAFLTAFGTAHVHAGETPTVDTSFLKVYKYHSDAWYAVTTIREQGISPQDSDTIVSAYFQHFFSKLYRDNLLDVVTAFHSDSERANAILMFLTKSNVPLYAPDFATTVAKIKDEAVRADTIIKYNQNYQRTVYYNEIIAMAAGISDVQIKTRVFDAWVTVTYSRFLRNVYDSDLAALNKALGVDHFKVGERVFTRRTGHRDGTYEFVDNTWAAVRSCDEFARNVNAGIRHL